MIKDDIISIAREAGCLGPGLGGDPDGLWEPSGEENVTELMFRFAELLEAKVRADEREACAHIVEDWDSDLACPQEVADAIRARGEK